MFLSVRDRVSERVGQNRQCVPFNQRPTRGSDPNADLYNERTKVTRCGWYFKPFPYNLADSPLCLSWFCCSESCAGGSARLCCFLLFTHLMCSQTCDRPASRVTRTASIPRGSDLSPDTVLAKHEIAWTWHAGPRPSLCSGSAPPGTHRAQAWWPMSRIGSCFSFGSRADSWIWLTKTFFFPTDEFTGYLNILLSSLTYLHWCLWKSTIIKRK